jgi:hypothetical protein
MHSSGVVYFDKRARVRQFGGQATKLKIVGQTPEKTVAYLSRSVYS